MFTGARAVSGENRSAHTMNPILAAARLRTNDVRTTTDLENAQSTRMTNHVIVKRATVLTKTAPDEVQDMIEEMFLPVMPHEQQRDVPDFVVATS